MRLFMPLTISGFLPALVAGVLITLVGALPSASAATAATAATQGQAAATPACPAMLQQTFLRLQDEKPQSLCQYSGKVLVVVNTASFCGFTPQYEGLEDLQNKYRKQGLVVLGFPSNDFSQESGSNKEVAAFCESTFGVKFPMFVKSSVSGKDTNPFFKQLAAKSGTTVKWNFYKYVITPGGKQVYAFESSVAPDSAEIVGKIKPHLK